MFPELDTERLRLRMFQQSDFEAYAAMQADTDVMEFLGDGVPRDRDDAWKHLATLIGHWHLRGYGFWAVEEKATGDFCGIVGLYNPEAWPEREITWAIIEPKQRRGFALEAAERAKAYAIQVLNWRTVSSCIASGNQGSIRLAEKMGASLHGRLHHERHGEMLIYRHAMP